MSGEVFLINLLVLESSYINVFQNVHRKKAFNSYPDFFL